MTSTSEQAAHWWVVMQDANPSAVERREFVEWVSRGPVCVEAYLRVARVHAAISGSTVSWPDTLSDILVHDALANADESVLPLRPHARWKREEHRPGWPLQWVAGLAASVMVIAFLGWWFAKPQLDRFQTSVGEQRSFLLADGSRVTLNTASVIDVRLEARHRSVQLLHGEALFEVAHDVQRPFDVRAGNVVLRDVGTRFNVDFRTTRTTITVLEGRVAMIAAGPRTETLPVLSAGDRVIVGSTGPGAVEHNVNPSETTAWMQHELVFYHRPLHEVADEFNRYSVGHIQIHGAALRAQEVTGTFRSDDVASFMAVLAGVPGVHVVGDNARGYVVTSDRSGAVEQ